MAIEFDCPVCGATIRVKDEAAGKKGRCPKCKTLLLVPEPEDEPPALTNQPEPTAAVSSPPAPVSEKVTSYEQPTVLMPVPPVDEAKPVPAPPTPAAAPVFDPADPFALPAEPPVTRPAAARKSPIPAVRIVSVAAAALSLSGVLFTIWFLYRTSGPSRTGKITAEQVAAPSLPPATFAPPADLPKDIRGPVMEALAGNGLVLKSEFASVVVRSEGEDRLSVTVEPGSQGDPVRVALEKIPAVQAAIKEQGKTIEKAKRKELDEAAGRLFRAYYAYVKERTPLDRLADFRDGVALNAVTGTAGYSVEAVIAGRPFRCVYEDAEGRGYFFLPAGTKTFRLRGRKLPDGATPVDIDFEVTTRSTAKPSAPRPAPAEGAKPKESAGKSAPIEGDVTGEMDETEDAVMDGEAN